jgi:hypothetical protein
MMASMTLNGRWGLHRLTLKYRIMTLIIILSFEWFYNFFGQSKHYVHKLVSGVALDFLFTQQLIIALKQASLICKVTWVP